jgi:hypothetical protein
VALVPVLLVLVHNQEWDRSTARTNPANFSA